MAIKINFDSARNIESPTIILARKNGDKLGKINAKSIVVNPKLNDASEISFNVNKYIDNKKDILWDEIVNFKLIYCVELDMWFEITVEIDESDETVKTVYGTNLGCAELSQIMLYNIGINTEEDIEREEYKIPTVLYYPEHPEASLLHRITEKAPHYSIGHVDNTIAKLQRVYEFDDESIYDALMEIAEEIDCLFIFDSNSDDNGNIRRTISAYDLESNCNKCGYRGEFTSACPKCGDTNINEGYGEDTTIFVTADEMADDIQFSSDAESIKNCFKLEAGDDMMTATIRSCNPNGSDYIWYISDSTKKDMSDGLVKKLDSYDELYNSYLNDYVAELDSNEISKYNAIVDKYSQYNKELGKIDSPVKGYHSLINAYYNTIDLPIYLESTLMPDAKMDDTDAEKEAAKLTAENISPVATTNLSVISVSTADNIVLSMAKVIVDSRYKVKVENSKLSDDKIWTGSFSVENYSDEEDSAISKTISVVINDDYETFVKQKIEKALAQDDTEDMSISGLFKKEYDDFVAELKKYSLKRLLSFHDACQACIDILIEQGIADDKTWSDGDTNLYDDLYAPYYNKLTAIDAESKTRQEEIDSIVGVKDEDGDVVTLGIQNHIEDIIESIQDALDIEKYLGNSLWVELCSFRREDKYSNDNYISDGLTNAELIKQAQEFIETAQKEIYKSSEMQKSISSTLRNLLGMAKFAPLVNHFELGNWIRVMVDDEVYKLRLISYSIDYDDLSSISVEFSDITKSNNTVNSIKGVLSQASSMATSYSSVKKQAKQGKDSKETIDSWMSGGLDTTNTKIVGGSDNQSQTWDDHGMLFKAYDPITNTYEPTQLKIINSTIAITDDNWKTTRTAIGKYYYIDPVTKELKEAYGINGETIIGKLVLGENLLFSNKSGSLSFDDNNGLTATNSADNKKVTINPEDSASIFKIQTKDGSGHYQNVLAFGEDGNLIVVGDIMANSLTLSDDVEIESGKVSGLSDVALSGDYSDLYNTPSFSAVATSGSYNDLTHKPSFSSVATSGNYDDLENKPSLSNVAISGQYDDLSGKPNLSTVATSGKYTDLTTNESDKEKLLFVNANGDITSIGISELKDLLGI